MSQEQAAYQTLPTLETRFSTIAPVVIMATEALFSATLTRGTPLVTEDGGATYEELTPIAAYDEGATYAANDIVVYRGGIYQTSEAITTPEAWDTSKWTLRGFYKVDGVLLTDVEAGQKGVALVIGKVNGDYIQGYNATLAAALYPNILAV
jgi:hypothetical protein